MQYICSLLLPHFPFLSFPHYLTISLLSPSLQFLLKPKTRHQLQTFNVITHTPFFPLCTYQCVCIRIPNLSLEIERERMEILVLKQLNCTHFSLSLTHLKCDILFLFFLSFNESSHPFRNLFLLSQFNLSKTLSLYLTIFLTSLHLISCESSFFSERERKDSFAYPKSGDFKVQKC